jgi:cytochrome P450
VACPDLVPLAVEEALRYDSPVQLTLRRATVDVELPGGKLSEGEMIAVLVASANRDERQFADAARFDMARNGRSHLAFGFGTHFCVGAGLARLEARVALEALVTRLARIERVETALDYGTSLIVRGPRRLRLRFETRK